MSWIVDSIGLVGFCLLALGLYLAFGPAVTLITAGSMLIVWAIFKSRKVKA